MRIGTNPNKDFKFNEDIFFHQIVIPLYLPNDKGYFKDGLKIFQLCIDSLIKTCSKQTFITIVNNGSSAEVRAVLNQLVNEKKINEVIHTTNIGKNNAIIKGIAGHQFKMITIADADVLFLPDWQHETYNVFNEFSKAGVVGLVPQFKLYTFCSFNILFDYFFSDKLKFRKVLDPKGLIKFYKSIGWKNNYNKDYLKKQLTLKSKSGYKAVVGSGHFVATYKREALDLKEQLIDERLSTKYDRKLLDEPVLRVDGYRLTTEKNLAYHMGNVFEDWMLKEVNNLDKSNLNDLKLNELKPLKGTWIGYFVKNHIFRKIISNKFVLKRFLKFKKLPKEMIERY